MATHVSASVRETPHVHHTKHSSHSNHSTRSTRTNTILNALKNRALAVLNDRTIDPQSRAVIRYALETNDPWLAELVRRADDGDLNVEAIDFSKTPPTLEDGLREDKIRALTEMICQESDEAAATLLLLMATIENATNPKLLANRVKEILSHKMHK